MKEFTSTAEMQAHYREVRKRLNKGPPPPAVAAPEPEPPPPPPEPRYWPVLVPEHPIRQLGKLVAAHYKIKPELLTHGSRLGEFIVPRHVWFYIAHDYLAATLNQIGRIAGRDHSSVVHGYRKIRAAIETDEKLFADVEAIKAQWRERKNAHQD